MWNYRDRDQLVTELNCFPVITSGVIEVVRAHKVVNTRSFQRWQHNSRCHISHPQGLRGRWENEQTKPSKYFSMGTYVSTHVYACTDKWWLSARGLQAGACSGGKPSSYFQNKGTLGGSRRPDREAALLRKLEAHVLLLPPRRDGSGKRLWCKRETLAQVT